MELKVEQWLVFPKHLGPWIPNGDAPCSPCASPRESPQISRCPRAVRVTPSAMRSSRSSLETLGRGSRWEMRPQPPHEGLGCRREMGNGCVPKGQTHRARRWAAGPRGEAPSGREVAVAWAVSSELHAAVPGVTFPACPFAARASGLIGANTPGLS